MLLKDFIPAQEVQDVVQLYRIVHLQFPKGQVAPAKAYPPRPEQCLAFYPYDTETVVYQTSGKKIAHLPVVLYGQFTEVTNRIIGNNFLVFQIIFHPGALFRLTGIPSTELTNQYMDAGLVFSSQIKLVNEQLAAAKDYKEMVQVADVFVQQLIKQQRTQRMHIDDACLLLLNSEGKFSLDHLSKAACLSSKQLERKFKERTGVNPKLFERIIRFDKVFRYKNSHPQFDWLRIAVACDYHDYQHLSKEYKDFTGFTPVAFHEIENKAPERAFGLAEGYYK